jgi:nucleoside-diphosphate-sugar epimerase
MYCYSEASLLIHQEQSDNRVLVTGGTGFLGRHTLPLLVERGFDVHVVARKPIGLPATVSLHSCDLLSSRQTTALIQSIRPTHLLHLAWCAEPKNFWHTPVNFAWLKASLHLFDSFADHGGHRIVGGGSCAEYTWSDRSLCSERATPTRPTSLYGQAKLATCVSMEALASVRSVSAAWARLFFLYGPGGHVQRMPGCIIDSLLNDQLAPCSTGIQARDYMFIEDAAEAIVGLLASCVEGPVNIGTGQAVPILDITNLTADLLGRRHLLDVGAIPDSPENNPSWLAADVTRLRDEVGVLTQVSLADGLARTINWYENDRQAVSA